MPYPPQSPRILIYALGNYTHPGTRHSLAQFLLGSLSKELDLPILRITHGTASKSTIGNGRMEEKKVDGWAGWIGSGWMDLVDVKKDIFGRPVPGGSSIALDSSADVEEGVSRAHVTISAPREAMNVSGRNLANLIKGLSTISAENTPEAARNSRPDVQTKLPRLPTVVFLHDSLEIPSCTFKPPQLKASPEGHNGLRSVSTCPLILHPPNRSSSTPPKGGKFWRIPLGIGRPGDGTRFSAGSAARGSKRSGGSGSGGGGGGGGEDIARWVMGKLDAEERLYWEGEGAKAVAVELRKWARGL